MATQSNLLEPSRPKVIKSLPSYSHREVVEIVSKWCLNQGYPVVLAEFVSWHNEIPDVLGLRASDSMMIEVKVSRADFLRDKKKHFRYYEEAGVGHYRYYSAPKGLIHESELPDGWGLVEIHPSGKARKSVWALRKSTNYKGERNILYSYARRAVYKGYHAAIIKTMAQEAKEADTEVTDLATPDPADTTDATNPPPKSTNLKKEE